MNRKRKPALCETAEPGRPSRAGSLIRQGRVIAMASVLAVAPMVTGFPQLPPPAQAHPVKSHVRQVGFVQASVAALRAAGNATGSVVRTPGAPDPISTAQAVAVTPVQEVAAAVTVVGVTWPKGAVPVRGQFQIRTLTGATWSRWASLGVSDGGPDGAEAAATTATGTDPYLVTGASKYEVRSLTTDPKIASAATVQVVDPGTSGADNLSAQPGGAAASAVKPPIYTRAEWGADESMRKAAPLYGQVQVGFVHHTADNADPATANSYAAGDVPAIIRAMYTYHVQSLGWDDIGYNFLIDRFGRTWEGRYGGMDRAVVGAQTLSYNSVSTGVSAIGNFDIGAVPQPVTDAFKQIFAWKLSLAGIPATGSSTVLAPDGQTPLQRVSGHRDAYPTICPGRYLYAKLPEIRAGAAALSNPVTPPTTAAVTRLSDFDGDGFTDLVTRNTDGALWLYPDNGAGGFLPRRQMGIGWNGMNALVTPGDVTGDGNADLLARDTAGVLWLYPGNGASGLSPRRPIGIGWQSLTIASAGDLNGTGRPDLLARDSAGGLWLYPLTGNAVFGARTKIGAGWKGFTILGPGDFSADGRSDILARDTTGSLRLYRGNGTGGIAAGIVIGIGWQGMTALVSPGNWDRAGGNDVLGRDTAGRLWLYPGTGTGSLMARRQIGAGWQGLSYIG